MAVTTLSQSLHDAWAELRPGIDTDPAALLRSGLVSDLVVGDFVIGARAVVQSISGTGTTRTLVLRRLGVIDITVAYQAASTIWFTRP